MKLFGNKRNAARVKKSGFRLSGVQRGLLLLLGSFLVLGLTVFAVYKDFVKPVELNQPSTQVESDKILDPEDEPFIPPTVIQIETTVDDAGNEIQVEVEVPASYKEGFYNILLVGTDDDGTRTDTIMIGRINVKDHTVAVMSIPRDTLIDANYNVPKINSVYGRAGQGKDGMEALKNRLANLLGFEVNGYVLVDLDAFIELVDLVGGVDFYVPQDMDYDDPTQDLHIHYKEGMQHLDGQSAMEVVRFRSGYATADIRRTEVQQEFLQVLAEKCMSEITLTKMGEVATIFKENVVTDLSLGNIVYFGQELLKCDFENMFSYTLEGESVRVNGADCYALYLNKTLNVVNEYFNPYETDITAANVRIRTPEAVRAEQSAGQTPEDPDEPDDPVIPDEPDDPVVPDEPDDPVIPDEPDDPVIPGEPDDPVIPDEPDDPVIPDEPDDPVPPEEPDDPVPPEEPDEPDEPTDPGDGDGPILGENELPIG